MTTPTHQEAVTRVSQEVIGKAPAEAADLCVAAGLTYRWISVDGNACMVTADCRFDRIGFVIENGIVKEAQNG